MQEETTGEPEEAPQEEGTLAIIPQVDIMNAPEMSNFGTYHYDSVTKTKDLQEFSKKHLQMIYGTAYILHEKLWAMGALENKNKPLKSLQNWIIATTKLQKPGCNNLEDLLRVLVTYVAMVESRTWTPKEWMPAKQKIPLPEIIVKIWVPLVPFAGKIEGTPLSDDPLQLH